VLGTIPIAQVLDLMTVDDDGATDCFTVGDILPHKRTSPHYPELLEEIRERGMEEPIIIRTAWGKPWLVDGHHRVAAAVDLGMTHLVWSDLRLEVDDCPYIPMQRGPWGPYRPAALPAAGHIRSAAEG
jgi:hypothetical protein